MEILELSWDSLEHEYISKGINVPASNLANFSLYILTPLLPAVPRVTCDICPLYQQRNPGIIFTMEALPQTGRAPKRPVSLPLPHL